jgi:hypothetical protein
MSHLAGKKKIMCNWFLINLHGVDSVVAVVVQVAVVGEVVVAVVVLVIGVAVAMVSPMFSDSSSSNFV